MKSLPLPFLFSFLLTPLAFAGSVQLDEKGSPVASMTTSQSGVETNFRATTDYVGSSDFEDSGSYGDQDAFHASVELGVAVPIHGPVYFVVKGFYERFDFGTSLAPVPTTLQKIGTEFGIEYRVKGKAALALRASPGFYGSEIDSDGFNVPLVAFGSYQLTDSFVVVAGVRYNEWSDYPFLPLAGFVWTINDKLKVKATLPDPAVEYAVNADLLLRVGGELLGGTYKTSTNEQNFPHQNLDYYDVRAGAGVSYHGLKPLDLRVSAGWSLKRKFLYGDDDKDYETEAAPYVSVSAGAVF